MSDKISPSFRAIDVEATDEGIILIHADETEAQKAYCEGQIRGYKLKLEGSRLTWLLPAPSDKMSLGKIIPYQGDCH